MLQPASGGPEWWLLSIYDPSQFIAELHELRQVRTGPWLLVSDFNMVYKAKDKINDRLNLPVDGTVQALPQPCLLEESAFEW
jgi:hypothetical protein